ncbi:ABC transporter [Mycobacteroides abscessus subsp. bolletii]|uniref:YhgE/Pip domain-containing protein n=1 Tax=Mycobacteroides abscessus TaxID=36809 RepID=UPI0005DB3CAC|nr:YhgE/Pip domain-containing protein [Mycobacteroides abscessus]MDO3130168.1 YhgE/Pip domain-containing protein [Mycobacteroides abscessus subsp. bolletii]MDO3336233.1 YhgE/Pip domain-containing protein [Mycobacteroides abscessus subsp. bolletii]QSM89098.1 YhgE/Pip domain-containing protein [Mycobacteroides abscessus subsp. bolletii]CPW47195.1 ABC transporter [Mycobacteroides abscessus]SHQ69329.1 ABC transporter [Mycobacteroides abscessus subsp. bolletii]
MLAGLAFGSEIKRFGRSRMTRAAIVVLMLLPLVYGALYLWAYWDPFGHVNKMPVALVNADKGATVSGQHVNIGEEISKSLTADGSMDWHVLSLDEARSGVDHGNYYFMLELPPDFSEAIASPLTGEPKQANLVAVYNDANNYISSSIGRTAIDQVLNAVSTRISGQAVNQVLSVVVSSGAGIQQAADGARQLADGAAKVDDGAGQLATGLHTARPGSAQLATGAKQLSDGINQATDPLLTVTKAVANIGGSTDKLQQGAEALRQANDQIDGIAKAQDSAANALTAVIDQLAGRQDPAANTLRGIQDQLREHQFTPQVRQQLTDAENASIAMTETLRGPGSPLKSALDQVGGKGQELTNKLTQLRNGAQQLATGNAQLASGIAKMDDGAQQLKSGTAQLRSGSAELATKLTDGAKQVPTWSNQQKNAIADTIGGPVHLETAHENAAPNFGTGMAPFFVTLALFFGALVLWMILRPLQTRAIAAEVLPLRVALSSYLPAATIGIFQAIILYCVVRFALGMHAAHPVAMLGFMVLISFAFVAATQAINALVGPAVGRVLLMALLMLQLVSAGGMYPVETTSRPFQILHKYDPMTYGVNGLRQLILGGIDGRLWQAVITLLFILLGGLLITSLSARRNQLWNLTRLLPSIKM